MSEIGNSILTKELGRNMTNFLKCKKKNILFYDLVVFYFQKLWAVCDLAISLLFKKTTNFELKEFPAKLNLSELYFKEHPDGENFVNGNTYIPTEMIYQPPKKAGASLFISRKATATSSTTSIKSTGKVRN